MPRDRSSSGLLSVLCPIQCQRFWGQLDKKSKFVFVSYLALATVFYTQRGG